MNWNQGWRARALAALCVLLLSSCGGGGGNASFSGNNSGPPASTEGVVVVGQTSSLNFPTTLNALFSSFRGGSLDGYVTSINFPSSTSAQAQLRFSTYFGGNDIEQVRDVALDSLGNIYITGRDVSTNLPVTPGAFQSSFNGGPLDAFVAKLSPTGQLIFCTYLGGSGDDVGYSIAVDAAGFIYVSGRTNSQNFPVTPGAFQQQYGGGPAGILPDAFAVKMKPDGSGLVWATYLGGANDDTGRGRMVVDASGAVYVEGSTSSANFPTTANAAQRVLRGSVDAFISKISPDGSQLLYSTYLGGNEATSDGAFGGIAVNSLGETYVCGTTSASNFPATAGAQKLTLSGPSDMYVARLGASGNLLAATLLGGSGFEDCQGLVLDSSGQPIVFGTTTSSDYPITAGAFQKTYAGGAHDFAITKFSSNLSSIVFSTYLGGPGDEVGDVARVDVDPSDNIILTGVSDSISFPVTSGAVSSMFGGGPDDTVIVKLSADGSHIIFATYLGGSGSDFVRSIRYRPK